jgi:hypothetical protein
MGDYSLIEIADLNIIEVLKENSQGNYFGNK